MEQALKFINYAHVEVKGLVKTAEAKIYVNKILPIEICQTFSNRYCSNEVIVSICITNNSNQDIKDLELMNWLCSNGTFSIRYIELQKGCYHICPDHIYFYFPLLKPKDQLYITLSLCTNPYHCITNCIKTTHYTINSL